MLDYLIPHPDDLEKGIISYRTKLNIVNVHNVFIRTAINIFMPPDTKLIASLCHLFAQLQSAFNHYNLKRHLQIPDVEDPLKEFLKDPTKYDKR